MIRAAEFGEMMREWCVGGAVLGLLLASCAVAPKPPAPVQGATLPVGVVPGKPTAPRASVVIPEAVAPASGEVFVDARPRRQPPLWYSDLAAWKQSHREFGSEWIVGVASKALSEEQGRALALRNALTMYGLDPAVTKAGTPAEAGKLVEEDSYLRVFGPNPQMPQWYYLAILFRVSVPPPTPAQAYQQAMSMGLQALAENRLLDARSYFVAADGLRRAHPEFPPVVELEAVAGRLRSYYELLATAEAAARRREVDAAVAGFQQAGARARELGMAAEAAYTDMRRDELRRGVFDRWLVVVREAMSYQREAVATTTTEPVDLVATQLEAFVAGRGVNVVSLSLAGLGDNPSDADIVRVARRENATYLLLGDFKGVFRTWYPARPVSDARMPMAKGSGSLEVVDLRSGDVIWKEALDTGGVGQETEREACENALRGLAKRARVVLERDAAKLGL